MSPKPPSGDIETFQNPGLAHDYTIRMQIPEFTCLCPMTGQPDFATLSLEYIPDRRCVELKSLMSAPGLAFGASERILFVRIGMQEDGKVAPHRLEAARHH